MDENKLAIVVHTNNESGAAQTEAVLRSQNSAQVFINEIMSSTRIIDVTGSEPVTYKGYVPPRSVVVPGSYRKQFPAGEYSVSCALIIGRRKESTDKKTSLNDTLREFNIS